MAIGPQMVWVHQPEIAIVFAVKVARITWLIKGKLALPPVQVLTVYMSIWPDTAAEYS